MSRNTDVADFAAAVAEFEAALPGWWWSVGQCSVGAHASAAVDGRGEAAHLLNGIKAGHPYDAGIHVDTQGGSPAEALRAVMQNAIKLMISEDREYYDERRDDERRDDAVLND